MIQVQEEISVWSWLQLSRHFSEVRKDGGKRYKCARSCCFRDGMMEETKEERRI
jgi:hypothetical protein